MADILKYVSLENLKTYDAKIKTYISDADVVVKEALEAQVDIVAKAITNEEARAKAAEQANATAASAAQTDVDNLETYVGTFTASDGVDTVVKYIDAKTANIASDETVNALAERVTTAESDIDAVETRATSLETAVADRYTKAEIDTKVEALTSANSATQAEVDTLEQTVASNKTAIEGTVSTLEAKVDANESDIEGKMTSLTSRVVANETAVGTTLPNAIDAVDSKVDTLIGDDSGKSVRAIANEELAAQLIAEDAKESLDTLAEIAAWIQSHPDDASAMNEAIVALQNKVDTGDKTVSAYVTAAIDALSIGDYAKAADLTALAGRVSTLETAIGSGGSVASNIATAKQEAVDTAAADATTKANQALTDAKAYADAEDAKIEARVDTLESASHTHSNKALLDTYTQTEANLADAVAKKHEHSNLTVLEGITASKVSTWDTVTTMATASALSEEVTRAKAKEDELQAAIDAFEECTTDEINALFA